jgi:DNA-binding MarR family transcriptional regulator
MLAMGDDTNKIPRYDNIRNLFYHLAHVLDQRGIQYRKGTRYEHVRQSDAQVFVQATRRKMSMSEIARELKITRQAVQASVKRLRELDVVDLEAIPGNRRDKWVVITPSGVSAQATAVQQIAKLEEEIAASLGAMDLETFRGALTAVLEGIKKIVVANEQATPSAVTQPE